MIMSKYQPIVNLPGEIWAPAWIDLVQVPGYYVSTCGRVKSTLTNIKVNGKFAGISVNGPEKLMTPVVERYANGSARCQKINMSVDSNLFEYSYASSTKSSSGNRQKRKVHIHRLVMDTFLPIFDHPPERLKSYWDQLPFEVKKYIYESITVDHKDHDPTNNHIDNLHYVTPRENTRNAIKFYDGNYMNKSNTPKKVKTYNISLLSFTS